jgi:hypothetical protein
MSVDHAAAPLDVAVVEEEVLLHEVLQLPG